MFAPALPIYSTRWVMYELVSLTILRLPLPRCHQPSKTSIPINNISFCLICFYTHAAKCLQEKNHTPTWLRSSTNLSSPTSTGPSILFPLILSTSLSTITLILFCNIPNHHNFLKPLNLFQGSSSVDDYKKLRSSSKILFNFSYLTTNHIHTQQNVLFSGLEYPSPGQGSPAPLLRSNLTPCSPLSITSITFTLKNFHISSSTGFSLLFMCQNLLHLYIQSKTQETHTQKPFLSSSSHPFISLVLLSFKFLQAQYIPIASLHLPFTYQLTVFWFCHSSNLQTIKFHEHSSYWVSLYDTW